MVRQATAADAEAIAHVEIRAWQAAYGRALGAQFLNDLSEKLRQTAWEATLAAEGTTTLVAEDAGGVVGVAAVRTAGDAAEIDAVYVDPAHWRQGHGRALLSAAFQRVDAEPWQTARAWVFLHNAMGRAFFATLGFRMDGEKRHHDGTGADEVRLARTRS